eukprot:10751038-Alexandrium_andersonii.AAC.1
MPPPPCLWPVAGTWPWRFVPIWNRRFGGALCCPVGRLHRALRPLGALVARRLDALASLHPSGLAALASLRRSCRPDACHFDLGYDARARCGQCSPCRFPPAHE